jgi:hypothetical protein
VARHAWVLRHFPFVAGGVEVRVADAAVENLDVDIVGEKVAAGDFERGEGRGGGLGGVGFNKAHMNKIMRALRAGEKFRRDAVFPNFNDG